MTAVLSDFNGSLLDQKKYKQTHRQIVLYYTVLYYCNKNVNV